MNRLIPRWPVAIFTKVLLAFLTLSATLAFAQATSTGTVTGVVTDPSGAVVSGATITLIDTTTGTRRSTVTNEHGQYVLINVPPATYNVSSTMAGFEKDEIQGMEVSVGTQTTANFKMIVGAMSTTVEVQAQASDLQTINATIGDTVNPLMMAS